MTIIDSESRCKSILKFLAMFPKPKELETPEVIPVVQVPSSVTILTIPISMFTEQEALMRDFKIAQAALAEQERIAQFHTSVTVLDTSKPQLASEAEQAHLQRTSPILD